MLIAGPKGTLWIIIHPNQQIMISVSKVNLGKYTCGFQLIEQVIYPMQQVLILDGYLVKHLIVHT